MVARHSTSRQSRTLLLPIVAGAITGFLLLGGGCSALQPAPQDAALPVDERATTAVTTPVGVTSAGDADGEPVVEALASGDATLRAAGDTTPVTAGGIESAVSAGGAPTVLRFDALDVIVPVEAMSWRTVRVNGVRTTRWNLPDEAAGWHPNSAHPGETGTMIISGSQLGADGVFVPIALGEVTVGQTLLLTTAAGDELSYTVTQVSQPLAIEIDPEASSELLELLAPVSGHRMTLLTGWPDFTTTHRIAVVAELSPAQP